jgi:hypothetical protein
MYTERSQYANGFRLAGYGKTDSSAGAGLLARHNYFEMNVASQVAEKLESFEGDGLQAVRKRLKTSPALAAEGTAFAP